MKRLQDIDEFQQSVPRRRRYIDIGTGRIIHRGIRYVSWEEFVEMQTELKKQLEIQATILKQALYELKQIKYHLASVTDEDTDGVEERD